MKKFLKCNGYILIRKPYHPHAFSKGNAGKNGLAGYVYEHIYVAERELGRSLKSFEEVHHMDFDRSNNCWSNLLVLTRSQHSKLHKGLERSFGLREKDTGHKSRKYTKIPRCEICKYPLNGTKRSCSPKCNDAIRLQDRKIDVDRKRLHKLLSRHSWTKVAKYFRISDNGLRKHAKRIGLDPTNYRNGKFVG